MDGNLKKVIVEFNLLGKFSTRVASNKSCIDG